MKYHNAIIHRDFGMEVKEITDAGEFMGYASVFGNVDFGGDIVDRGAFKRTIDHSKGKVPILWQHDTHMPIGIGVDMYEDENGLWVKGKLNLDSFWGKEAYSTIKAGIVKGLSIGYDIIKDLWNAEEKAHHLVEVRLWEYSIVTFPMNALAQIGAVKRYSSNDDILIATYEYATDMKRALKEGRVLSARNVSLIEDAIAALTALIQAAGDNDTSKQHSLFAAGIESLAPEVRTMIAEMKRGIPAVL